MAKTVDLRTYLLLERAFVRRLQRSWRQQSAPTYAKIHQACLDHRWDEARRLVPDLDMAEVGTENREWITYMLLSCAVFGAGMVSKSKPSFVGVGSFDTFLKQVTNNFLMYLEFNATAQVQAEALQSIAEDEAKTKALKREYVRDAKGQFAHTMVMSEALLRVAQQDTARASGLHMSRIENDAAGVVVGATRSFDDAVARGEFTLEDVAKAWNATRAALREQYGDTVILHRHESGVENPKTLTVYMGDKALAEKFGPSTPYEVPVDDVIAVYARPSGYYEFIVKKPTKAPGIGGITRKFDESKHPRDKDGRFAEATTPRIFNRPSDVKPYESFGGGTRWGWLDPKTGETTGMLLTGEPIPREGIPPKLYHVTTNAPAVESSGVLLGQRGDTGLGGGQAEGVSFTSSPEDAVVIQRELRRAIRVARGEDRIEDLDRYAREDEQEAGLPPHTLDDAVQFAKDQWVANQQGIEHTFVWDKDLPEDKRGYVGPPPPPEEQERLRRSSMNDALKAYLQIRGKHDVQYPLLKNPILFGRQEHLAKLNPEHVQILETAAEDIPAEALVSTGSDKFLHEVRVYADVPRRRKKAAREYVREPAGTAEGGQFADAAMSAPILQGVNSKANAQREIDRHLDAWLKLTEKEPTPEALKATEAELRALPMVHGTTVAGALGAVDQGLLSHADMEAQRVQLLDEIGDLEDHIVNIAGEVDWEEVSQWTEEQVHDLGLDRQDAQALLEYVKELQDIKRVMAGSTNTADEALGLDQFVFMTHGEKHQDYGNVAVIIDNDVMQKGFATERDIITTPGITDPDNEEHYAASGVESYQRTILKGDDYYAVAAAKAGSPDALLHRSREQLFEIKVPRVPKDEVLGFVVDDFETAQRLSDKLARRGKKEKVLYVEDQSYSGETKRFVQNQLKALQATGMWDDGLLERFREQHEGAHIL